MLNFYIYFSQETIANEMKFLRKFKVFHRIIMAFVVILVLIIGLNIYIVSQINELSNLTYTISKHPLIVSNAAMEANRDIAKMRSCVRDIALSDSENELNIAIKEVDKEEKKVYEQLDLIKKLIIGQEGKNLEKNLRKLFKEWKPMREEIISLIKHNRKNEAIVILKKVGSGHVNLIESKMIEINQYAHNKANLYLENSKQTQKHAIATIIGAMLFVIVLSFLIAVVVALSITTEIVPLREAMILSSNTGELKVVSPNGKTEITEMINSYNVLINKLKLQAWYQEGVNKISNLLLLEKETLKIAEVGLDFICQYGSFPFGLICTYYKELDKCKLISLYGSKEETELFKSPDNECLMVKVAKSHDRMFLNREELIKKAKILNISPHNYYFLPIIFDNELIAVIVLGSNDTFTDIMVKFIDNSINILGSSLFSSLNKENLLNLNKLLQENEEQLTQQNEELQAIEEQLTQQNEELQAVEETLMQQNDELQAKEEILIKQNQEINHAFELLSVSEDKYRSLYSNMNESVVIFKIVYDIDGKPIDLEYLDVNSHYESSTGRKKEVLISKYYTEVFDTSSIIMFDELIEVEKTGKPISKEVYFTPTDKYLHMSAFSPKKDLIVVLFTDITDKKNDEEALKLINMELKKVNKHKNKFLATMSHELRTPLNAILGFSETLIKKYFGDLNEKQLEYISLIHNSGQHLLLLINDILDISKIDSGSMDLQLEKVSCCDLLQTIISLIKPQYEEKNISLNIENQCVSCSFEADKQKIKQIMLNLLTNAIKFTPQGGSIFIKIEKHQDSFIKFTISDTGVGIKEDDLEKIFTEFYQADHTRDQALGGSGIGLALCKRLVEMHDGKIFVESKLGKGSIFSFILPGYNE